ncbi:MAG: glycosyltransferase family 4 protein [Bacteroidia bacterium]|nr:glycosyltransferase family 4 protein [Bacteroidia bacterium]
MRKVIILREIFDWMGDHSGYDQVFNAIIKSDQWKFYSIYRPKEIDEIKYFFHKNIDGMLLRKVQSNLFYNQKSLYAEANGILKTITTYADIFHISYVENNFSLSVMPLFFPKTRLIGTVHQPPPWYEENFKHLASLKKFDSLIVLSHDAEKYFQNILHEKVNYIPHGVDTTFFTPQIKRNSDLKTTRILFSGHWLRDIKTLYLVAKDLTERFPDLHFDLLVPINKRYDSYFKEIALLNNIHWYANLSDMELLQLYQQATILFMPLLDCTANNAILEGMSCGVPIVSNNIGGIKEYTDTSFTTLKNPGDVAGLIDIIVHLIYNKNELEIQGISARNYALTHFSWDKIAAETIELYTSIISLNKK